MAPARNRPALTGEQALEPCPSSAFPLTSLRFSSASPRLGNEGVLTVTTDSVNLALWFKPDKAPHPGYHNDRRAWERYDRTADPSLSFPSVLWGGCSLSAVVQVFVRPRDGDAEACLRILQVTQPEQRAPDGTVRQGVAQPLQAIQQFLHGRDLSLTRL